MVDKETGWNDPATKKHIDDATRISNVKLGTNEFPPSNVSGNSSFSIPTLAPLSPHLDAMSKAGILNKYDTYREMRTLDPVLSGAIQQSSTMVGQTYDGVWLETKDDVAELGEDEKLILAEAEWFASREGMNFRQMYISIADNLIQNADFVAVKRHNFHRTDIPLRQRYWRPLPMASITAVQKKEDIGNPSAQAWEANFYVLNEGLESSEVFAREDIVHLSLNNYGTEVYDNQGRYTLGIWSISLLQPLETTIKYKWNTIQNDIRWRHLSLPRLQVKVDTSAWQPDNFDGATQAEKITAAKNAANTFLKEFRKQFEDPASEQGTITDKETEMIYVEPRATTYASPNGVITQENKNISAGTGVPQSLIGGDERGFSGGFISSSFAIMHAESISEKITDALIILLREHVHRKFLFKLKEQFLDDVISRLQIRTRDIFLRDRVEKAQLSGMLAQTGVVSINEVRKLLKLPPLSDKQIGTMNTQWGQVMETNTRAKNPINPIQTPEQVAEDIQRKTGAIPTEAPSESRSSDDRQSDTM